MFLIRNFNYFKIISRIGILFCLITFWFIGALEAKVKKGRISVGAGVYNFMENGDHICREGSITRCGTGSGQVPTVAYKNSSLAYNIEIFSSRNIFKYIKPFVGFMGTTDNASYSYVGLSGDLFFLNCKCLVITPSLAAGWYVDGDEIKLGHHVEFRSGGDISYKFKNNVRVGVGIFHISNAMLGDRNPGSEQAILKYQGPF